MQKVSTEIKLDTRKPLVSGTYTVKLRVIFQRQVKYYPTEFRFTKEEYELVQQPNLAKAGKIRDEYKKINADLAAVEAKAVEAIKSLPVFSFYEFERRYKNKAVGNDLFSLFDRRIAELKGEGRMGTADSYDCARNSLLSFVRKEQPGSNKGLSKAQIAAKRESQSKAPTIPLQSVTAPFLKDYEKWMLQNGRSLTTIGIYLRPLRALFNEAIEAGDLTVADYPFTKRKYQIPAGRNIKKALDLSQIGKLFGYQTDNRSEAWARDIWLFSYFCNGMNIKDIALLRYRQVTDQTIVFLRAKTIHTTRESSKPIVVRTTPDILHIIEQWGNKPKLPDSYVFPILKEGMTPEQEFAAKKDAIKHINKYIRKIALAVGIEKDVTTYVARHSFATVLTRAGVPTPVISVAMGHNNEKTTKSYQDSLPLEGDEIGGLLKNFGGG